MNVTEATTESVKAETVIHNRWLNLGRREPVFDIYGKETWGTVYQCAKCGFTTTAIEDHGCYIYCPNCGIQNIWEGEKR